MKLLTEKNLTLYIYLRNLNRNHLSKNCYIYFCLFYEIFVSSEFSERIDFLLYLKFYENVSKWVLVRKVTCILIWYMENIFRRWKTFSSYLQEDWLNKQFFLKHTQYTNSKKYDIFKNQFREKFVKTNSTKSRSKIKNLHCNRANTT